MLQPENILVLQARLYVLGSLCTYTCFVCVLALFPKQSLQKPLQVLVIPKSLVRELWVKHNEHLFI